MEKQSGNVVFYQPYKYSSLTGLQGKLNFKLTNCWNNFVLSSKRKPYEEENLNYNQSIIF